MNSLTERFFTCFEDLSNEILYEIFEYLDFYDIYKIFSILNQRYYNLIHRSNLLIKLNLSSISISSFQNYYKHIIIPYRHRINSIYLTNPFIYDLLLLSSSHFHLNQFSRLETLILENISSENLENLFQYLTNLSSLIIKINNLIRNQNIPYHQIFHLPLLKYCKISFKERLSTFPLPICTKQFSSIEHLIIDHDCHMNELIIILSYLPKLCRLSCTNLIQSTFIDANLSVLIFNSLTHLSFKTKDIKFDYLELFFTKLTHQLQVFSFSTNFRIEYLNAKQWENFIQSKIPNLRHFNLQLLSENNSQEIPRFNSINQFMTSFWFERKWFFQYEDHHSSAAFYSIKQYRTEYILNNCSYQDTYPYEKKNNFHFVKHIISRGNVTIKKNCSFFSNATELSIYDYKNGSLESISTIFDRILPLTKLTKFSIYSHRFSISQLLDLLYFSPNIQNLTINSISFSKISLILIQTTQTFQKISQENQIRNLTIKDSDLGTIQLFYKLCPRLEQVTINSNIPDNILHRTRIAEMFTNSYHIAFVHFCSNIHFRSPISNQNETFLLKNSNCLAKSISRNLYIWS